MHPISAYIIHLPERTERLDDIRQTFAGQSAFDLHIITAKRHMRGNVGLWQTITGITGSASGEYILLCEDDHRFTDAYTPQLLFACIGEAKALGAELLCGGVSWFSEGTVVSERLLSVKAFTGLQFTIIFQPLFNRLARASFGDNDAADLVLSGLSRGTYVFHPFISVQHDYGYSDVTPENNRPGRVDHLFLAAEEKGGLLRWNTAR
ncbi:hypothetical protein ACWKWU_21080 [Chitinophaga lutea]